MSRVEHSWKSKFELKHVRTIWISTLSSFCPGIWLKMHYFCQNTMIIEPILEKRVHLQVWYLQEKTGLDMAQSKAQWVWARPLSCAQSGLNGRLIYRENQVIPGNHWFQGITDSQIFVKDSKELLIPQFSTNITNHF